MDTDDPDDLIFQSTFVAVSSKFNIQTVSRLLLAEIIQTHRLIQLGLDHNNKFSLSPHIPNQQEFA